MVCCPTSIFIGLDIAFMHSKTILEISNWTNILPKVFLTGYQIDNIITIIMKDSPYIISSIGETACEIIGTYYFFYILFYIILYYIFFIVRNWSFFMGIIFCSSIALVWTFNTTGVYNFITKKANIPVNLIPFFNDVSFLFCCFWKSRETNELKSLFLLKSKKLRVIYSKQDKPLLLIKC